MYNVNNNGPSMDPWGTPYDMSIISVVTFSRDTDWIISVKGALYIMWCGVNRLGDSGVKVV